MPSWVKLFESVSTKAVIQNDPIKTLGKKILELAPPPAKILEIGCGSGLLSGYLADFGYQVVATDKDPAVLAYAKKRLMEEMLGMPLLLERDGFFLKQGLDDYAPFDLCWSAGVLEHFQDQQIVELLRQQVAVANLTVFSVPSSDYPRREMGDERLMDLPKWFSLMQQLEDLAEPSISYYRGNLHLLGVLHRREPL